MFSDARLQELTPMSLFHAYWGVLIDSSVSYFLKSIKISPKKHEDSLKKSSPTTDKSWRPGESSCKYKAANFQHPPLLSKLITEVLPLLDSDWPVREKWHCFLCCSLRSWTLSSWAYQELGDKALQSKVFPPCALRLNKDGQPVDTGPKTSDSSPTYTTNIKYFLILSQCAILNC